MIQDSALPIASMQKRFASFVIDDIIISLFFLIIFYGQITSIIAESGSTGEISQATLEMMNTFLAENIMIVFAIKVIYQTVFIWQNGMTVGKYITKTKVISLATEEKPGFQQAFLRATVRLISDTFFYLGYLMAFFMPMRQTLHDKLSNCVVVDA
jgi:uncharacterized RDD family membrane protein YckC